MQSYYIKLALLFSMWSGALITAYKDSSVFFIYLFTCTLMLILYFLLPIISQKVYIYILLLGLTQGLIFLWEETIPFYLYILSFFYLLEMMQEVKGRASTVALIVLNCLNILSASVLFGLPILLVIVINVFLGLVIYRLSEVNKEYKHIRETYDSLLNDYRVQKRRAFHNEKTARAEERSMIAREMHDAVGHKLTALIMQVELLRPELQNGSYPIIKELAAECLEETRRAVRLLQAEDLQGMSALVHLIKKLESENTIHVHFTARQGVLRLQLSNRKNAVLYRTIQEGLTNAMKYGSNREVFLNIGVSPIGYLTFEIKNTYHHKHPVHKGFGLENMAKRLEEEGGKLSILQHDKQFILTGSLPAEERSK
ncbi:histidine kinase [Niallia taxi]|uniref:sensor histidine kinase n=1 Tax=Niallia taxi TaxID=2499688 RepID=UPI0016433F5F|nr:histidine kinase [Niallia taxi]WOD62588.1 histidine kinase [Niallia taxi]